MNISYHECFKNYETYTFGYSVIGTRTNTDTLDAIHAAGFLPYSANLYSVDESYYMARSMRIELSLRKQTSEERRVLKKHTEKEYTISEVPLSELKTNREIREFFRNYFILHGGNVMQDERIEYIATWSDGIIRTYRDQGRLIGIVIERYGQTSAHYWYVAYDLNLRTDSIGVWIMIDSINRAITNGLKYFYLGTGYNTKALYKIQNPSGLSFWDGSIWNTDIRLLKEKLKSD